MSNDELARFFEGAKRHAAKEAATSRALAHEMIEHAERELANTRRSPVARALAIGEYLAEAWNIANAAKYSDVEKTYAAVRALRKRAKRVLERESAPQRRG